MVERNLRSTHRSSGHGTHDVYDVYDDYGVYGIQFYNSHRHKLQSY